MPAIVIKDYEWRQTSTNIIINVKLFGNPKKIDFLTSDKYVKASYPPFILEIFLWETVNDEESECTFTKKEAIICLKKKEIDLDWPTLEIDNLDKELKRKFRQEALEYTQLNSEQKAKAKSEKREKLQREAVRSLIDLETATLNEIESIRDSHRKEAMKELEEWRLKAEKPIFEGIIGEKQENRKAYRPPLKWFKESHQKSLNEKETNVKSKQILKKIFKKEPEIENSSTEKITEIHELNHKKNEENSKNSTRNNCDNFENIEENLITKDSEDSDSDFEDKNNFNDTKRGCLIEELNEKELEKFCRKKEKEERRKKAVEEEQILRERQEKVIQRFLDRKSMNINKIFDDPNKSVPLPRKSCTINVSFSERVFPTPARESYHLQEQEWLEKQAEARRKTGFVSEDLRPEEQNPQWLKDKGDDFFKAGNYLGAISAYSHGIKISEKMASLYVNRSAAHYALGNFYKCTEDCSKALELMIPKCEGNRESRTRCHARRGAALCKLSAPQHGIPELEAALKLAPDNESIKLDLVAAKKYFKLEN